MVLHTPQALANTLIELAELATLAPSGHNAQPWRLHLTGNTLELHPDLERALPLADPENRELYISLGCATEHVRLAARERGLRPLFSLPLDENGVAFVRLELVSAPPHSEPMVRYFSARHTNRQRYTGQPLPAEVLTDLEAVRPEPLVMSYFFERGSEEFGHVTDAVLAGNRLQLNDPYFRAELTRWLRFNRQEVRTHRDGLSFETMGFPPAPLGLGHFFADHGLDAVEQNRQDRLRLASSSHVLVLTSTRDDVMAWVQTGMSLERLLLTATAHDLATAFCNPPCEVPALRAELRDALGLGHQWPQVICRLGYGQRLLAPAPRRRLADVLV